MRGGRVIEMYEGERRFDSWVTTPHGKEFAFYYPSGITSIDEERPYLPAVNVKPKKHGVNYTYYDRDDVDNESGVGVGLNYHF